MGNCKNGHVDPERNSAGACRECLVPYHRQYRKEYKSRRQAKDREKRERRRLRAMELLGGECLDCGNPDERVLVFDHVRGKKVANIARLLNKAWERIEAELRKCDLVCANCHLIRTNERIPKPPDTFVGRLERKTHCPQGHPWIKENIYTDKRGINSCLECRRIRGRSYARKRGEGRENAANKSVWRTIDR